MSARTMLQDVAAEFAGSFETIEDADGQPVTRIREGTFGAMYSILPQVFGALGRWGLPPDEYAIRLAVEAARFLASRPLDNDDDHAVSDWAETMSIGDDCDDATRYLARGRMAYEYADHARQEYGNDAMPVQDIIRLGSICEARDIALEVWRYLNDFVEYDDAEARADA